MRIGLSLAATEPRYNLLAQNIRALFADGSQGWWYDDNDTTTLFQDSAGTTPVTAVEQFVGLQLDKSRGLVRTNIAPNPGTSLSGWTVTATNGGSVTSTASGILLVIDGSGTQFAGISVTGTAGIFYEITATVEVVAGAVDLQTGVIVSSFSVGTTTRTVILYSSNGQTQFKRANSTIATTAYIRNISIRELPGNHRYAPASGNRPIWSKRVNLLTKTEQFDDAAWTKRGTATITPNDSIAPNGTLTADRLSGLDGGTNDLFNADYISVIYGPSGLSYTPSIYIKRISTSGTFIVSNPTNATFGQWNVNMAELPDAWVRITATTPGVTVVNAFVTSASGQGGMLLRGLTGGPLSMHIWGADARPANQATGTMPLYQRVNTSSDYDTNGFPGYLKADGVDDFLQTNSINFTATDKITLCAGVRKLSDAARGIITELSAAASNAGIFNVEGPRTASGANYRFSSGGSLPLGGTATSGSFYAAPITNVLTGIGEISTDTCLLQINGALIGTSALDQGTGNYGNYPAYFFRRGGTTLPFTGYEYGNVAVGKLLTADQLRALETYMNGLTKAY